jgi:hypothetical protein
MIRPCFLGSGIATHLGTGVDENLAALHESPTPPQRLLRRIDDRVEGIPYKPLDGFPLASVENRLDDVIDAVVEEACWPTSAVRAEPDGSSSDRLRSTSQCRASPELRRREATTTNCCLPASGDRRGRPGRFGLRGEDYTFNTAWRSAGRGMRRVIRPERSTMRWVLSVELISDPTSALGSGPAPPVDDAAFGAAATAPALGRPAAASDRRRSGSPFRRREPHDTWARRREHRRVPSGHSDGTGLVDAMLASAITAMKAHVRPLNDEAEAAGAHASRRCRRSVRLPFIEPHPLGACGLTGW